MRKDFKAILFLSSMVSFTFLVAQEVVQTGNSEISMSTPPEGRCPTPDECSGEKLGISSPPPRVEEYDYDVYVKGTDEEESPCPTECPSYAKKRCNKRKGAAKIAQE